MPCFFDIPAAKNSSTIHFVDASMSFLTLCGSCFVIHCSLTQESYGSSESISTCGENGSKNEWNEHKCGNYEYQTNIMPVYQRKNIRKMNIIMKLPINSRLTSLLGAITSHTIWKSLVDESSNLKISDEQYPSSIIILHCVQQISIDAIIAFHYWKLQSTD